MGYELLIAESVTRPTSSRCLSWDMRRAPRPRVAFHAPWGIFLKLQDAFHGLRCSNRLRARRLRASNRLRDCCLGAPIAFATTVSGHFPIWKQENGEQTK